jgi:hypothetical protein
MNFWVSFFGHAMGAVLLAFVHITGSLRGCLPFSADPEFIGSRSFATNSKSQIIKKNPQDSNQSSHTAGASSFFAF